MREYNLTMRVAILAAANNSYEKKYLNELAENIQRLGFEVSINTAHNQLTQCETVVAILDGRDWPPEVYVALGYFWHYRQSAGLPKKLMVGYELTAGAAHKLASLKLFDHLAQTEKGLIACLKDYLFYCRQSQSKV